MEAVLREIAAYERTLKRLAKAEQKTLANVGHRYQFRRDDAWNALSPAARRLIASMMESEGE